MTAPNAALADKPEPFDPQTDCHPNPEYGGANGCPNVEPCKLRCHIGWLDGWTQPNDDLADAENAAAWERYYAANPGAREESERLCRYSSRPKGSGGNVTAVTS